LAGVGVAAAGLPDQRELQTPFVLLCTLILEPLSPSANNNPSLFKPQSVRLFLLEKELADSRGISKKGPGLGFRSNIEVLCGEERMWRFGGGQAT
jgi:hypothetical protein